MKDLSYYNDVSPQEYHSRKEFRKALNLRETEFRTDLATEYNVTKEAVDFAWVESHSYGLSEVINTLEDLLVVIEAERNRS